MWSLAPGSQLCHLCLCRSHTRSTRVAARLPLQRSTVDFAYRRYLYLEPPSPLTSGLSDVLFTWSELHSSSLLYITVGCLLMTVRPVHVEGMSECLGMD